MNNSFDRLIDGMIESIRAEILPNLAGDFARGQAFGVIFLLKNLKLRAGWSPAFLGAQVAQLEALRDALAAIEGLPADAPRITLAAHDNLPARMEAERDAGDAQVAALIDWCAQADMAPSVRAAVDAAVNHYIKQQLRYEIDTTAPPMFAEMSLGREQEKD